MTEAELLAQDLLRARREGGRVTARPLDLDTAYEVQGHVAAGLGPVGGFKYACRAGGVPVMAPIAQADIIASGARFDGGGHPVGIELEVGFRLNAPPPPPDAPDFEDRLRASVSPVAAIELVQTRIADLDAASPDMRLADHQLNGGLVIGDVAPDWSGDPLAEVQADLRFDDQQILQGTVALPFGPAFDCLATLVRMAGTHCGGLQAGHYVITGSLNGLPWLPAGTRIAGHLDGIGAVSVDLT